MAVDLRAQQVKEKEQFEANVDTFVAELKTQIDEQSEENINKFEEWFNEKYSEVVDMTEAEPEMIMYATKSAAQADSNAYLGYGILSMGVVLASATYLYKKRQAKQVTIDNSGLLQDQGFEQV